jgi:anti-sigma regulatory factor (Ser/Thr protein kinase)
VVVHAYAAGAQGVFDVDAAFEDGEVVVRVRDYGRSPRPYVPSKGLGMGLRLMDELCDTC